MSPPQSALTCRARYVSRVDRGNVAAVAVGPGMRGMRRGAPGFVAVTVADGGNLSLKKGLCTYDLCEITSG